jgi:hypothetical protein
MEIERIIYKAKDGRIFYDPLECEDYEKTIGILDGSVGDLINIIEKSCKEEQYVSGIILVKGNDGISHIFVYYTGCIDEKLEDYVNVEDLTEEQRYESATIGMILNRLKQLDKDLPCQYMIAYSDHLNMYSPGMMANYNAKAWNNNNNKKL